MSSSVAALLIGGGAPAAFAACANNINASFDNPAAATTPCVAVTNTSFSGNITNEGTIAPGGITFTNGTISGFIASSGNIAGGLSLDNNSTINNAVGTAVSITSSTFLGGISNAGLISGLTKAINVSVTSFGGGIGNTGTISAHTGIVVQQFGTFQGGISNGGIVLSVNGSGIAVFNGATFSGPISNSGTVSASSAAGITVEQVTLATGGITNSGTITTGNDGLVVSQVATFAGAINNSGRISGQSGGIFVTTVNIFGSASAGGGIVNSGTIVAPSGLGVRVLNVATFLGGITNIGLISAGPALAPPGGGIIVSGGSTFLGGILNAGTITAASGSGIKVNSVSTFLGGITNAGMLSAAGGAIAVNTVAVFGSASAGGGILNSGTITAASGIGIKVNAVSSFFGGISNSGIISAGGVFTGVLVTGVSTFQGGISNGGTITAALGASGVGAGILVTNVATFTGGITNSGLVGGSVAAISVFGVSTFLGGISNSGTLQAVGGGAGLAAQNFATFGGGISNGGTISTGFGSGILAFGGGTFSGPISNSGVVSAGNGIGVGNLVLATGGITNSGTVAATNSGIYVTSVTTFTGGISNSGLLTHPVNTFNTGIAVTNVETFSGGITNSGTITGFAVGVLVCGCMTTFGGGVVNSGLIAALHTGIAVESSATFDGGIVNRGTIVSASGVGIQVSGVSAFTGGITNAGTIAAGQDAISVASGSVSTFVGDIVNNGTITTSGGFAGIRILFSPGPVLTMTGNISNSGTISGSGAAISVNAGIINGGVVNNGKLASGASFGVVIDGQSFGTNAVGLVNNGSITARSGGVQVDNLSRFLGGITNTGTISAAAGAGILIGNTHVSTFLGGIANSGTITGVTGIRVLNGETFGGHIVNLGNIAGTSPLHGAIDVSLAPNAITIDQQGGTITGVIRLSTHGDTLNITGGAINGDVAGQSNGDTVNFTLGSGTFTYAAPFAMSGLSQVNFNSGTVFVDGAIQATSLAVNSGATAAGTGLLAGNVTVMSGGTLMPGNAATPLGTINVMGSLTFNASSFYSVHVTPSANSATNIAGAPANVLINGGTVQVTLQQAGNYNQTYTIVTANGGRSGTFASVVTTGGIAFNGTETLTYDATHVFLTLSGFAEQALLPSPGNLSVNQQNVLNGINTFINAGNILPPGFQNLFNLNGPALANALTQLSGENNAGFFQGAFQAGNGFLGLMVNPFLDGRFGNGGGFGAAMGFAAEEPPALPQAAAAFASAMPVKAAPAPATFEQRFSVWGATYGGSGRVLGDPILGSHDTSASAAAFAAGIDYRLSPDTVFGIALAGGGTSWNLTSGLGGGRSDMFQAGVYGSHHWGAAYVSGALAYNFHDVTTNRTVTIAGTDMLQARFQANGVGARIESGYRYAMPWLGITPYAAAQVQSIALPSYGETATAGSNQFALNFASQTATTTRTELGAWLDRKMLMQNGALLTLYGRGAWAHDFGNSPSASAIFQALPGSNFIVNGAVPARDGALVTGAAQYSLASGWAFLAKFDGEFSSTTSIYSGSGMVRKTW